MYPGAHSEAMPDKPAVIMGGTGEVVTYAELEDRSTRLANALHDRGLELGDRVAILAENHVRYFEIAWAILRSGLYLVPVNRHLSPEETAYLVNDSGAKALITTAQMASTATAVLPLIPECPHRLMVDGVVDGFASYEAALDVASPEPWETQPRGDMMLYSSGTTGRPKGIVRPLAVDTVDNPDRSGISMLQRFMLGMDENSVYLCPAPLYHSASIYWSCGVHELGATVVIVEKFDAEGALRIIDEYAVTHTQVVPTMMVRMLALGDDVKERHDLSSLERLVHAAAPCPPGAKKQMIEWIGPIVSEYYSGTEGSGMTWIDAADWLTHPGSVGKAISGTPQIIGENGEVLPVGEIGTVFFSDGVAFEYHGDEDKTRDSRHPDNEGWSTLGDIGYLDEDGFLYLTDRKAFTIISGGVNIYPAEIESVLIMHPDVVDVAVFGLPDPEMGEFVQAVVQLAPGVEESDETVEGLRSYAREHLAGFKVPRAIGFHADLPRLPTGKLAKQGIREEFLGR